MNSNEPLKRISSFAPIVSEDAQILILGSVPGVKSLEMQQYYAHPQNQFWRIIFHLFNENYTSDYVEKLQVLKRNKIALWNVIDTCERKGSLDSEIRNEEANDIRQLLKNYPNIKAIFCNGQKSFKNLQKIMGKECTIPIFVLPSTSPLHTISFEKKLREWEILNSFL